MSVKERLRASDYAVYEIRPSQIDPNVGIETTTLLGHKCPRCKTMVQLSHGKTTVCPKCQLSITLNGNAMECEAK